MIVCRAWCDSGGKGKKMGSGRNGVRKERREKECVRSSRIKGNGWCRQPEDLVDGDW